MLSVNRNPSARELRTFGWVMFGGCLILGLLLWWAGRVPGSAVAWGGSVRQYLAIVLWVAGPACLVSSRSATVGRPVYVGWMTFARGISMVMTTVLLTVMFFVVLPVFSLIRLKDPLRLKGSAAETYWENHEPHEATLERTGRPF